MLNSKLIIFVIIISILVIGGLFLLKSTTSPLTTIQNIAINNTKIAAPTPIPNHPLSILGMRQQQYPGSDFVIKETLVPGSNYKRYIASYQSEGLTINGLLTVPTIEKPAGGFPAIVFNHGYIPPEEYQPTERYLAYVDWLARDGFVVFRPDYRGNADSEGSPTGAYFSPGYTVDVLNAFSSLQKYPEVNPEKIGMWGHSMGGFITQKAMVINPEIKAGVIWGGVVGSYEDMFTYWWNKRNQFQSFTPSFREQNTNRSGRQQFIKDYGDPKDGNQFWKDISATSYITDISGPIQLHHGLADETVPWELSRSLKEDLEKAGKTVEYYTYPGADHNISDPNFSVAMTRSIKFFEKYLR